MRDTPETGALLDRRSLRDVAHLPAVSDPRRHRPGDPATATRTAAVQVAIGGAAVAESARREVESGRLESLLDEMVETARRSFTAFAESFDFGRHCSLVDIGGATGELACLVAERHAQVACRSVDLAIVQPIAERRIRARGLAGRVRAEAIDFLADEFPAADVITMGLILRDWNVQRKKMLIRKAHRALPPGGAMVAIECADDGERIKNGSGVLTSPGMVIEFGDAFDLTGADFVRWCAAAGFSRCEVLPLAGAASATIAYK